MPSAAMMTPQKTWLMSASRHCAQVSGRRSIRAAIRPAPPVSGTVGAGMAASAGSASEAILGPAFVGRFPQVSTMGRCPQGSAYHCPAMAAPQIGLGWTFPSDIATDSAVQFSGCLHYCLIVQPYGLLVLEERN